MLTQERLKTLLSYDADSGIFVARVRRGRLAKGSVAGCVAPSGYNTQKIDKTFYLSHRLAWLYVHGSFPVLIDHINGDKLDNRICNLREADRTINARNAFRKNSAESRFRGLYKRSDGKWIAQINLGGRKVKRVRCCRSEVEAAYFYDLASLEHHGEFGKRNFLPLA